MEQSPSIKDLLSEKEPNHVVFASNELMIRFLLSLYGTEWSARAGALFRVSSLLFVLNSLGEQREVGFGNKVWGRGAPGGSPWSVGGLQNISEPQPYTEVNVHFRRFS